MIDVEQIARILYECEKVRAESARNILAGGKPTGCEGILMEPYDECADAFRSDARAVVAAMNSASEPVAWQLGRLSEWTHQIEMSEYEAKHICCRYAFDEIRPLYTHPVPPQTSAVAAVERLHEEYRQRTGSTDHDLRFDAMSKMEAADEIIRALKEAGRG